MEEYERPKGKGRDQKDIYWEEIMGGPTKQRRDEWNNIKENKKGKKQLKCKEVKGNVQIDETMKEEEDNTKRRGRSI